MTAWYRFLLRLYPAGFRREYGSEMEAVFRDRLRDASGPFGRVLVLVGAFGEAVGNGALTHLDVLRQDLRDILRAFVRTPGFAVTAILVTALGVGANAAAFSLADFALIRPLPFPDPDRLVRVWQHPPGYGHMELSPANYRDWKAMNRSFTTLAAYSTFAANLVGAEDPERIQLTRVTPDLLDAIGVTPALGRGFTVADGKQGAPATAILSHAMWQSLFGGDPGVLGRVVNLDDQPFEVIGVMPPAFQFPTPATRILVPFQFAEGDFEDRSDNYLQGVGRLKPGVTLDAARSDLALVTGRLAALYPEANRDVGATASLLQDGVSDRARALLLALVGASLAILVIACANLGSLLLARGLARSRELAVRSALGAGRERIIRKLMTEGVVIAVAGGIAGVGVAALSLPLLSGLIPDSLPLPGRPGIDLRVLGIAITLTLVTSLLFAVLPAWWTGRGEDLDALREGARGGAGGRRKAHLRAVLVVIEVSASVVLLVGAGLLIRAIERLQRVDPGYSTAGVLTVRTALPFPRYGPTVDRVRFYDAVLSRVQSLPGVTDAAYATAAPLAMQGGIWPVVVRDESEIRIGTNTASLRFVTPGYFKTLEIPVQAGRDLGPEDRADVAPVAVVSTSFGERYWPGQSPLGRRFTMAYAERTIVGVVADVRMRGPEIPSEPQVYLPAAQGGDSAVIWYWPKDLIVRTTGSLDALVPTIRQIVREADPTQPVSDVRPLADLVDQQVASRTVQLRVLATLAVVALLLAAVGIHGLLSYSVSQRVQEIGVRMALGARGGEVVRLVMRQGLFLAVAGIVPGVFLAYLGGRAIRAVLFDVPPSDPMTFGIVVTLCVVMAVAGSFAPALRAVRVDPLRALRAE